ncbi:MAG: hypothetical protein COV44_10305 [Deltaproteobacteria bacterium CG11_big_fil_rev_8_21_14_0_20_45_16]|nr:MAG: hypothetical protein COV44_10305 [Deltaproteobacteria bacterium CG11_big_fil_rev_8_21_14_0_20_45_16]
MPSPTAISELHRKLKRTKAGKERKRAARLKGTINYYTYFATPASDEKSTDEKSTATKSKAS